MAINKITNETNINNVTASNMFNTDMVTDDDYVVVIKELYDRVVELKTAVEALTTKLNETIDKVNE
jgi:mannitol-specific phosphotransferase system IIBC component